MNKRMISRIKVIMGLIHSCLHRQHPGLQNEELSEIMFSGKQRCLASEKRHSKVLLAEFRVEGQSYDCLASSGCSNNASISGWANTTHTCKSTHNDHTHH